MAIKRLFACTYSAAVLFGIAVEAISNNEQLAEGSSTWWADCVYWADGLRQNNIHQWLLTGSVHAGSKLLHLLLHDHCWAHQRCFWCVLSWLVHCSSIAKLFVKCSTANDWFLFLNTEAATSVLRNKNKTVSNNNLWQTAVFVLILRQFFRCTLYNNNNNNCDNVYGAVIMTKVISRVHPVYLMNSD